MCALHTYLFCCGYKYTPNRESIMRLGCVLWVVWCFQTYYDICLWFVYNCQQNFAKIHLLDSFTCPGTPGNGICQALMYCTGCCLGLYFAIPQRWFRADSRLAPSQWETTLQSNAISHWLGSNLGMHPANERHCYKITPSFIGWAQT